MPTYEYRCPECGTEFEKFQKMSESQPELPCPVCGESAPRRMSAGAGLVFKGSGFYITDYGKDGKKSQRAASSGGDSASSSGGDAKAGDSSAKSESRPESKSEAKPESKPAAKPSTSGGE